MEGVLQGLMNEENEREREREKGERRGEIEHGNLWRRLARKK